MYVVAELFTEGLSPTEYLKRAQRVRGEKKTCKGQGCLTRVSAYNLDAEGNPERLCYKCQGIKEEQIKITEEDKAQRSGICKHGHILLDVGIKHGVCAACVKNKEYKRARKKAEGKTYYPRKTYLVLESLDDLMTARGLNPTSLGKAVEIPNRSLRGYALDGTGCPPDRAMTLARYFGVSVEELCSQSREVAM